MEELPDPCVFTGCPCSKEKQDFLELKSMTPAAGSIQMNCEVCTEPCWIGPNQQLKITEFRTAGRNPRVLCFCCMFVVQQQIADDRGEASTFTLKSLGGAGGDYVT